MKTTPEDYFLDTSRINKSGLDLINKAPALYFDRYLSGDNPENEKYHFKIGRALHVAVLQPYEFWTRYAVLPHVDRRTIDGRERWSEFMSESAGKVVLRQKIDDKKKDLSYDQIMRMRDAILSDPIASELLKVGRPEQILHWEKDGIKCKSMLDFINLKDWIVDLKTIADGSEESFVKSVRRFRYHSQEAFYTDAFTFVNGRRPKGFIFITVEKKRPYLVSLYALSEDIVQDGRELYEKDLQTYKSCRETNTWPGYAAKFEIKKINCL